jgi:hypothetical protein
MKIKQAIAILKEENIDIHPKKGWKEFIIRCHNDDDMLLAWSFFPMGVCSMIETTKNWNEFFYHPNREEVIAIARKLKMKSFL